MSILTAAACGITGFDVFLHGMGIGLLVTLISVLTWRMVQGWLNARR